MSLIVVCIAQSVAAFGLLMANIVCAKSPSIMILLIPLFAPLFTVIIVADASPTLGFVLWMNSTRAKTGLPLPNPHMVAMVLLFCLTITSSESEKTLVGKGYQSGSCWVKFVLQAERCYLNFFVTIVTNQIIEGQGAP